jgi:hypothetical protein
MLVESLKATSLSYRFYAKVREFVYDNYSNPHLKSYCVKNLLSVLQNLVEITQLGIRCCLFDFLVTGAF